MPTLSITCPECSNEPVPYTVAGVRCGLTLCECACERCGTEFGQEVAWWRWAGLDEAPPEE